MPRGKFRGTTSYGDSFPVKQADAVTEFRCRTEMSKAKGSLDLMTVTREFPSHSYGRPVIHRPPDNDLFYDDDVDEGYSSSIRASTALSENYNVPLRTRGSNHLTGYEVMTRTVGSSMNWTGAERDFATTNKALYPTRSVKAYKKVDRNDFDKHIDFGFDSPVGNSVYGSDFKKGQMKKQSPVYRKMSTVSLEASNGPQESQTTYQSLFKGEPCSPNLPSLTEMDAHLRSSIELN